MTTKTVSAAEIESKAIERIRLAHGGGGELTSQLIGRHFIPRLRNERLAPLTDGAIVPWNGREVVFSTDSYVVSPLEFPGGDIGRLAVAGTVNDLAVMGAEPVALSVGLILEEGLPMAVLDRIVESMAMTAEEARIEIVTGDTKVIERRGAEAPCMFINTAGIGVMRKGVRLDLATISPGDVILVSGTIADHALTIMSLRSGVEFESDLRSDAAPLNDMIGELLASTEDIKFLRDATRGGLAGVLADISDRTGLTIEIQEAALPITATARHAAELLGLDPIAAANEGKIVCVVAKAAAHAALSALRATKYGKKAAIIGLVTGAKPPLVELLTRAGGRRIVQRPLGEELPRIC